MQHMGECIRAKQYEYKRHSNYTGGLGSDSGGQTWSMLAKNSPEMDLRNKYKWIVIGATSGKHSLRVHS